MSKSCLNIVYACQLLIAFANNLDLDHNVGPDLDPHWHSFGIPERNFQKSGFWKKSADDIKQNYPEGRVKALKPACLQCAHCPFILQQEHYPFWICFIFCLWMLPCLCIIIYYVIILKKQVYTCSLYSVGPKMMTLFLSFFSVILTWKFSQSDFFHFY